MPENGSGLLLTAHSQNMGWHSLILSFWQQPLAHGTNDKEKR
jgi:hypothetical protein